MEKYAPGKSDDRRAENAPAGTVERRQAWMIAASLFIALFFLWGGAYNTGPIFLAALLRAFGWSHARVGAIIGALSLAVGISAPRLLGNRRSIWRTASSVGTILKTIAFPRIGRHAVRERRAIAMRASANDVKQLHVGAKRA